MKKIIESAKATGFRLQHVIKFLAGIAISAGGGIAAKLNWDFMIYPEKKISASAVAFVAGIVFAMWPIGARVLAYIYLIRTGKDQLPEGLLDTSSSEPTDVETAKPGEPDLTDAVRLRGPPVPAVPPAVPTAVPPTTQPLK